MLSKSRNKIEPTFTTLSYFWQNVQLKGVLCRIATTARFCFDQNFNNEQTDTLHSRSFHLFCVECNQCDQIWRNFAIFDTILKVLGKLVRAYRYSVGQIFEPSFVNILCHWAKFHCCKRLNVEQII